ncbi:MAG: hypothetical protein A2508_09625 [Candidatus Lambdaproteobacteria bacterium RIFOXYD12_FULL_49_8]|uniref:Lipoprotein n=1 Tax=Candidatus Lambdaproteobacteria bacterium RIFOXYD2_FULL_50_16 TaxID=1817772 RepID=A0A1F6GF96_9PROT|nr:MAG: hypothetical protein A2527_04070 [Candidatus Lambdaproteobacteria bacterium RIFOXYD2_FULL_50_16]OGG97997.1 MAG: hypothetical protein A2508_09625 [Candidatus Lambdaproteobacteria bacterium RIFOXYD12_FULL_49_8]
MKKVLILLLITINLVACTTFSNEEDIPRKKMNLACAEPRLDSSFQFHDKAVGFLKSFYKTRKESELFFAWYASEDSLYMAHTIGKCFDKRNKHFHAMQNVVQKNEVLRRLIVQNMRQDSQAELSELFLDDYKKIFNRDIQ